MSDFYTVYINGEEVAGELNQNRAEFIAADEIEDAEVVEVFSPEGNLLVRLYHYDGKIHEDRF